MNGIPVIDMTAIGMNITRMRINAGLTVKDVQNVFGFSTPQAIYKWQRGETLPSLENLIALSRIFSVPMESILAAECRTENGNAGESIGA